MLIALGYIASIFMGLSLGLIGGGGSILTVPILVYLFQIDPVTATGYSLFVVGLTALFGSFSYFKKGMIDFKTGFIFAGPSFLGVYFSRAFIVPSIPSEVFHFGTFVITKPLLIMGVFAILMVAASISMIRGNKKSTNNISFDNNNNIGSKKNMLSPIQRNILIGIEGLIVGSITGFVGAGGGFLIIPALVILAGLQMRVAVGTSLMIIAIKSLFGFLGDFKNPQHIDWKFLLTIALIAIVGIFLGSHFSKYVPETKLKKAFGIFVLIMGSAILIQQLSTL